jgi:hypothetical protein
MSVTTLRCLLSDKLFYHPTNFEENLILRFIWIKRILTVLYQVEHNYNVILTYRGADKSLARPGRKQARKHVRGARDFNNIETRFFPARQGTGGNSRHSDRNISLFPSWSG